MVYSFGGGKAEGRAEMKNLLGGKGANLAEMANLGIPVPSGFTITTEVCTAYQVNKGKYPEGLKAAVEKALKQVERQMGAKFGDKKNPLLFSARSGARVSMPGMMDTVLNIGLNDETIEGLIAKTGDSRFAYDSYRRFVQMYSNVVMGMEGRILEEILEETKHKKNAKLDTDLSAEDWKAMVAIFKKEIKKHTGKPFPEVPMEQLWGAINAVFDSWNVQRAITYRRLNGIPEDWGTAVNVQAMVFGNMGNTSATGVAFTRDPGTGEKVFFGEYLINAQGEDVVAGIRTPQQVTLSGSRKWAKSNSIPEDVRKKDYPSLQEAMPKVYKELVAIYQGLEKHYREMQDIEFTIQQGKLWMLQTRTGKRTAAAAVKIAVDMVKEKLISQEEAILRVEPKALDQLLHPTFDPKAEIKVLTRGLPASPGAATGRAVFTADDAVEWAGRGEPVILVRLETSPEDIHGMDVAKGVLTGRGGMTSHAAVVARGMGKCCVAGAGELAISDKKKEFSVGGKTFKEGDWISLNGSNGTVIEGKVPTVTPELSGSFGELMKWADKIRRLNVRTNADTPKDSAVARKFGAEGIGLTRTEHMFFEGDRIDAVREMILADDLEGRKKALAKLLPMQRSDFEGIFKAMAGLPVTIRTLDPPLHEFLPHDDAEIKDLAKKMGVAPEKLRAKVDNLHEFNPMLGHRGCRLGIAFPEITEMQARAIFQAAKTVGKGQPSKVLPEVMIPLVSTLKELELQEAIVRRVAEEELKGTKIKYMVGTMIELPRAALTADEIAKCAEFFSFGTNDLTQTTFGLSRDDAGKFLPMYVDNKVLPADPFQTLDQNGVGKLVEMGIKLGRTTRPNIKVGICGEHGGDPQSVEFCHRVGMNYVSCSPYRVPIARLAAAHAALKEQKAAKAQAKKAPAKKAAAKKAAPKKAAPKKAVAKKAPKKAGK
jgi:pyruvate,orthophosphate dikinase